MPWLRPHPKDIADFRIARVVLPQRRLAILGADHHPRKARGPRRRAGRCGGIVSFVAPAPAVAPPAVRSDPFTAVLAWYPRIEHVQQQADNAVVFFELHSTIVALSGVQNHRTDLPFLLLTL